MGINPQSVVKDLPTIVGPFSGMTFVITGTLSEFTRQQAESAIAERGGKIGVSVSKKTRYLVTGTAPGSKLQKAQLMGTSILDEDAFSRLLEQGDTTA